MGRKGESWGFTGITRVALAICARKDGSYVRKDAVREGAERAREAVRHTERRDARFINQKRRDRLLVAVE